jgi:hypothetical protein|tara:strand:+ start:89 stop:1291 length:1203 start_codon:yes stop_codon:yes gene_type:complete
MIQLLLILLLSTGAFADELVTDDITEKDAGATHKCLRTNGSCTYDPRTDIWSDGGSDDDVIYWDQHGNLNDGHRDTSFSIMNDIDTFLTEAEMLAGFTLDSSIGLRDRNYAGGDPFTVQIKVTDGTTTYSDTQSFTTSAGQSYETITSSLVIPENTLAYSLATFGLILDGASLTNGYRGPQTNSIGLVATYETQDAISIITDIVNTTVDDIINDTFSAIDTASMEIDISSNVGGTNLNIPITVTPNAVVLSVPTVSGGIEKIVISTGMSTSDSQPEQTEVAEAVAEVESAMDEEESEESSNEEKQESSTEEDKEKAVQVIVNRVLQAVEIAGGDTDGTKLALMGILNTSAFRSYQRQDIPDVAFYDNSVSYESEQMPDLLGSVFNLGSDQMMEEMTNTQY